MLMVSKFKVGSEREVEKALQYLDPISLIGEILGSSNKIIQGQRTYQV